jgi:hypothetical protein
MDVEMRMLGVNGKIGCFGSRTATFGNIKLLLIWSLQHNLFGRDFEYTYSAICLSS